jgi:hypothetical protein
MNTFKDEKETLRELLTWLWKLLDVSGGSE